MDENKKDYWRGLLYFVILLICIATFFVTPDGDSLFYKFIGIFGLSPGIAISKNSTLYIYMLIPFLVGISCLKRTFKYWWHYGTRFIEYKSYLRNLPLILLAILFFIPYNIENIYYSVISKENGLKAIVYHNYEYNSRTVKYTYENGVKTTFYYIDLRNYGNNNLEFKIMFRNNLVMQGDNQTEIFIKDNNGNPKIFTLEPRESAIFKGEFIEHFDTGLYVGNGGGSYNSKEIVLINDSERYSPKPILKIPSNR